MKNKKIVFLSLGLMLIVATLVVAISAWLTDTKQTPDTTFTIGDVKYTIVGDFIADGIIVPGQELVDGSPTPTTISLTNSSTVGSKLRVRVLVTRKIGTANPVEVTDLDSIFTTNGNLDGKFILASGWTKVTGQNLWYYGPATGDDPGNTIPTSTTSIDVLSSLKLDGSKVGNDYVNDIITIKFTFEAKQADYVTWNELASQSIDFTTGKAQVNP